MSPEKWSPEKWIPKNGPVERKNPGKLIPQKEGPQKNSNFVRIAYSDSTSIACAYVVYDAHWTLKQE